MFAAFAGSATEIDRVYARGRRARVEALVDIFPEIITGENFDTHADDLVSLEVLWSTWGMPKFTAAQLERLPELRAVFYAAGSVRPFARPFLDRGVVVVSAWQANAVPVAEFALAQILLSLKGYFRNTRECRASPARETKPFVGPGAYGETVALLGAGAIGRLLIERLQPFTLDVVVFDPFLSEEEASRLGVRKVTLEEAFQKAFVVSNHLANLPATVKMLHGALFANMRPNATFINTGRGATVDEEAMIGVLAERPDLTALLDVTWPEPPAEDSPLRTLPNVQLSSHIAGSMGDEVIRMADHCIGEFQAWRHGEPLRYAVTREMLETMA